MLLHFSGSNQLIFLGLQLSLLFVEMLEDLVVRFVIELRHKI